MNIRNIAKNVPALRDAYHFILRNTPSRIAIRKNLGDLEKFDRVHGTDFSGRLLWDEIGTTRNRANSYLASPRTELNKILKNSKLSPDDTVVDMGCGKGYAMYLISSSGVSKVGWG